MKTIFRSGIKDILKTLYTNKNKKIHLRELARLTNQHGPNISRHLADLKEENIIKFEKDGNLKKFYLRNNTARTTSHDLNRIWMPY